MYMDDRLSSILFIRSKLIDINFAIVQSPSCGSISSDSNSAMTLKDMEAGRAGWRFRATEVYIYTKY